MAGERPLFLGSLRPNPCCASQVESVAKAGAIAEAGCELPVCEKASQLPQVR